jgi:lysophospholipase L1-like esterase
VTTTAPIRATVDAARRNRRFMGLLDVWSGAIRCLARRFVGLLIVAGTAFAAAACGSSGPGPTPVAELRVTCPASVEGQSIDGGAAAVRFVQPVASGGKSPVTTTCSSQPGSLFAIGSTKVTCQSRDAENRSASCEFTVTVRPPPVRYVAFGDSITWGVDSPPVVGQFALLAPEPPPPFAYPNLLEARLRSWYKPDVRPTVLNAGIGGEQAADGGLRRFRNVLLQYDSQVVLLMEGTNDLLRGQPGADDAIAALDTMIGQAQALNRTVFLATIPPQRGGGRRDAVARSIPLFNERIKALAASRNVVLVDVFRAMDLTLIGRDDLHPTQRGFEVIADTFFTAIRTHFERSGTTTSAESTP